MPTYNYPVDPDEIVKNNVGVALRADETWSIDWTDYGATIDVALEFEGKIGPAILPGGIAVWASATPDDTSGTGDLLAEIEMPTTGTADEALWGPNLYNEGWYTNGLTDTIVKSIAIDGSLLPTGVDALTFNVMAGMLASSWVTTPGEGELQIVVSPSNDPITNLDGTVLWTSTTGGYYPGWTSFHSLPDSAIANFTNPNPSGNFYLSFIARSYSTGPYVGFQGFEIDIPGDDEFLPRSMTATIPTPDPSKPYIVFTSFAGEMGEEIAFEPVVFFYRTGIFTITDLEPPPITTGDTAPVSYLVVPNSDAIRAGGLNRQARVLVVTDTTHFTYATSNHDYRRAYVEASAGAKITPVRAPDAPTGVGGPYTYDPKTGLAITATEQSVVTKLAKGQRYQSFELDTDLDANPALLFPDEVGWLVFQYGYQNQVGPVKYLGRLSDTELLLDASYKFPNTILPGSKVILLSQKSPWAPADDQRPGNFYVTGSAAGRIAAQKTIDNITAAGIPIDVDIVYPGDRGLGSEGFPDRNNYKITDAVGVWGGDDLDTEIPKTKEGE